MLKHSGILVTLVALIASCGGGDDGPSYAANCQGVVDFVTDCRRDFPELDLPTNSEVEQGCALLVLEPECYELTFEAGCEAQENNAPVSEAFVQTCSNPCSAGDASVCSGDNISVCGDIVDTGDVQEWTLSCDAFCEAQGGTYVGECSDNYMGQDSSTGNDVCWCES